MFRKAGALPVAVPGIFLADGAAASSADRIHSLSSLVSATGGGRIAPQTVLHLNRDCIPDHYTLGGTKKQS